MKRALRVDKIRLAALEATLKLYRDPDRLAQRLPTMRLVARPQAEIRALATRIRPAVAEAVGTTFVEAVGTTFVIEVTDCASQIGSGALPLEGIPSAGLAIRPAQGRGAGAALNALSAALRRLPIPVVGHIADQSLILDMRCLEDEAGFLRNVSSLSVGA
jgi:L-seryl-tRNA(Ser) seleniumtransferase